jgi:hypothetical protein
MDAQKRAALERLHRRAMQVAELCEALGTRSGGAGEEPSGEEMAELMVSADLIVGYVVRLQSKPRLQLALELAQLELELERRGWDERCAETADEREERAQKRARIEADDAALARAFTKVGE